MKHLTTIRLLIILMGCSFGLAAQITKGSLFLSSSISLNSYSYKSTINSTVSQNLKQNGFGILGNGGFFLRENLALTLGLGYSNDRSQGISTSFTPVLFPPGTVLYEEEKKRIQGLLPQPFIFSRFASLHRHQ
jgi:hypothetical protein